MVLAELEKALSLKKVYSVYVFYGEEKYMLENTVNKIKKSFGHIQEGINCCYLDEINIQNVISEIETPSFGFDKKLIVVKNAGLLKKETKNKKNEVSAKLAQYIESNINIIKESVVLVIIEDKAEKCQLLDVIKKIETNGDAAICDFQKLKINDLVKWLKKICGMYKIQVDDAVLAYLVEVSGTSMQNLMNEIRKLIEYAGEGGKITKEDVQLLAVQEVDNIIFNLTDSIGVKDTKKALETFNDLIYLKEPLPSIMVNLYRHFKKLYYIKLIEKSGQNINMAEALELKPNQLFLVSKYRKQATYFKEEELRNALKTMLELDENYKNGKIDLLIGLETIIMGV